VGPGRHIVGHNIAIYHRNADKVRVAQCRAGIAVWAVLRHNAFDLRASWD